MADDTLKTLFESYTGQQLTERTELPTSGSHRRYFRLKGGNISIVGVIGTSLEENRAFVAISKHFKEKGLNVPTVLAVSEDGMSYIQEDLGEKMLFDLIAQGRDSGFYNSYESNLLCRTMRRYPQKEFDARMVDFDLNYFKYCFLKATGLEFNEGRLQDDFERLKAELLKDSDNTFLYRDFQARNVIIRDGEPYFIDYQGGRRGPIYYDVASFIWQARARYPDELKEELIRTYLRSLRSFLPVDEDHFRERLRLFVLFRTLQVLGAYGFRGYFEKKPHFLASVPFALDNLRSLLRIPFSDYPYLNSILTELTNMPQFYEIDETQKILAAVDENADEETLQLQETRALQHRLTGVIADLKNGINIFLSCHAFLFESSYPAFASQIKGGLSDLGCDFVREVNKSDWDISIIVKPYALKQRVENSFACRLNATIKITNNTTHQCIYEARVYNEADMDVKGLSPMDMDHAATEAYKNLAPIICRLIKEQIQQ